MKETSRTIALITVSEIRVLVKRNNKKVQWENLVWSRSRAARFRAAHFRAIQFSAERFRAAARRDTMQVQWKNT